jgi:hypothetical protein
LKHGGGGLGAIFVPAGSDPFEISRNKETAGRSVHVRDQAARVVEIITAFFYGTLKKGR